MAYYKTDFSITVLSQEPLEGMSLAEIDHAITDGGCVGFGLRSKRVEIGGKEAAQHLIAAGSEPGFFRLDENGNQLEEDT